MCVNFVSFQVTFGTWPTCILTPSIRHRAMSCEVSVIDFDAAKLIENLNKPKQTRSIHYFDWQTSEFTKSAVDKLPNSLNQLMSNSMIFNRQHDGQTTLSLYSYSQFCNNASWDKWLIDRMTHVKSQLNRFSSIDIFGKFECNKKKTNSSINWMMNWW